MADTIEKKDSYTVTITTPVQKEVTLADIDAKINTIQVDITQKESEKSELETQLTNLKAQRKTLVDLGIIDKPNKE